jgi:DNA polymerase-3 subunit delta'
LATTKLENIFGQDKAKTMLLRSFKRNKLSHAYLFRGPAGVGKKTTAASIAAYLNCLSPGDDDFCGTCSSCIKFKSGNHPDYYEILPDGSAIKIGQIRELKKKLTFAAFEAKYRVVVLPDIHHNMRRKEVANSLLKTLEEPPNDTVFILTADESGVVLPTILSRCQVIPFYHLPYEEVSVRLQDSLGLDHEEAYTLAAATYGSLGQAAVLAEKGLLDLRLDLVDQLMTLEENAGITVEKIMILANRIAVLKDELFDFLDLLKLWVRDLLIISSGADPSLIVNQDLQHTYNSAQERWSLPELFDKLGCLNMAKKQLNQNCNRVSVCEMLLWKLL